MDNIEYSSQNLFPPHFVGSYLTFLIYSESEFTLEPYVYFVQELFLGIKGWIETSLNRKKPRRTLMGSITLSRILSAGKS